MLRLAEITGFLLRLAVWLGCYAPTARERAKARSASCPACQNVARDPQFDADGNVWCRSCLASMGATGARGMAYFRSLTVQERLVCIGLMDEWGMRWVGDQVCPIPFDLAGPIIQLPSPETLDRLTDE